MVRSTFSCDAGGHLCREGEKKGDWGGRAFIFTAELRVSVRPLGTPRARVSTRVPHWAEMAGV